MASDYTPSTREVRTAIDPRLMTGQTFDRWLASVERAAELRGAEKALLEAAQDFPASLPLGMTERDWLRARAVIYRTTEPTEEEQ